MTLRLITPPAALTVSLETAKSFLRVDGTTEDTLITSLLKAASEQGEAWARRAFITQTLEQIFDEWPADGYYTLWRPPLQSVTSIKYTDSDGVEHTLDAADYTVDADSQPGRVWIASEPSAELIESGGIVVRFVAGYGNADTAVPERIKHALLQLVAFLYENRGVGDVPGFIRSMFTRERVVWF